MDGFFNAFEQGVSWIDGKLAYALVPGLLFTGILLTLRLGFIQVRKLWHGALVTVGHFDKGDHTGDVSHFQALTTALSATVGVGNIAGVALAINFAGPGALFWMWVTAFFGMAVKYSECTLALHHRDLLNGDAAAGAVSGGPMYYIEKGLGWKPLAVFFACALMVTSFFTGNAIQANTLADAVNATFGVPTWITGAVSALLVAAVILGGIRRIGRITSILAPGMALLYVTSALFILLFNWEKILPSLGMVVTQAFDPVASATGVGAGSVLAVMTMGVKRGLFSNEAGQGSAPIAHAAAKTEEPVSEGVVALLEPFIDTLVICTITGLVILTTGVWEERFPTRITLAEATVAQQAASEQAPEGDGQPMSLEVVNGAVPAHSLRFNNGWVDTVYVDEPQSQPFTGTLTQEPTGGLRATDSFGRPHRVLFGDAVDMGAPLTARAFKKGLSPLGDWGDLIVTICVALFALSTAISWSYYGDRCATYLVGTKAIKPYRLVFCLMHFVGATLTVTAIWRAGDVALSVATLPNVLALVLLSGTVVKLTNSYFTRKPW